MKKFDEYIALKNIQNLHAFIAEGLTDQMQETVDKIVIKIKQEYGDPEKSTIQFLQRLGEKDGLTEFKSKIASVIEKEMDKMEIVGHIDFEQIIRGLIEWTIVEREIMRTKDKEE